MSDVEAFKEQIAEELKDVPNREEFENKISEEIANSKAEIGTQIETAKTQAETNAKAYADEINQVTAKVAEQANAAASEIKADLVNVKSNLTSTSIVANNAQAAVDEAKQDLAEVASELNTAKQDLANSVTAVNTKVDSTKEELTQAKQDLMSHAQQLQTQANAQTELTKRVTTVETTANGTKTTVSELNKTVAQNGKDITSVTARTKVVEDDLSGTKTTLSQVKTTADSASQKTATLETGLNGLSAKFSNLKIGAVNLLKNSKSFTGSNITGSSTILSETYRGCAVRYLKTSDWGSIAQFSKCVVPEVNSVYTASFWAKGTGKVRVYFYGDANYLQVLSGTSSQNVTTSAEDGHIDFTLSEDWQRFWVVYKLKSNYPTNDTTVAKHLFLRHPISTSEEELWVAGVQLEEGSVATDYSPNEADVEQKVADYKQTADQNYASLQTTVQNLDGTVQQNKTTAEQTAAGFKTRIESLETYKSGESTRANQYFELAKTETARQLTAERTAIAKDYVAKSTYTSDVTGIRNELSATTSTANATKTNLANYQASNDKVVASLKSSLQTTDGNVSNLQTKVEAVPGQITSAVSAVEGKIPTNVSTRNLAVGSQNTWNSYVNITTSNNWNRTLATINYGDSTGIQNGSKVNVLVYVSADNIVLDSSIVEPQMYLQTFQIAKEDGRNVWTDSLNPLSKQFYKTLVEGKNYYVAKISATIPAGITQLYSGFGLSIRIDGASSGKFHWRALTITTGDVFPTDWTKPLEDTESDITKLNTTLTQTASGLEQLSTQVTSQGNTITSHTNSINSLTTGLSAKVSQTDFNTLSGRVTTAENNITAKANELSSKITSVEGKIPTESGLRNYALKTGDSKSSTGGKLYDLSSAFDDIADNATLIIEFDWRVTAPTSTSKFRINRVITYSDGTANQWNNIIQSNGGDVATAGTSGHYSGTLKKVAYNSTAVSSRYLNLNQTTDSGTVTISNLSVRIGSLKSDWQPAPEDYDSKLATAQSEIKQTTDSIKASVQSLDNSTVKNSSLTINTDGVVIKAGKSTSDFANAIGSYFAVNQNAINLFSDKINVKGNMIVSGAITSDKIASKSINTAHLNGKIITADVIATSAVTADAIKAGAVTTDKMSANSINGDRITAGTLDAAKIKAGSITASQIASGTITSAQIKTGTISAANIAAGAITSDKIASNSIDASKIVANAITADKIAANAITADMITGGKLNSTNGATVFDLNAGTLTFNNNYGYIQRVANDKIFEITTSLSNTSDPSQEYLTSAFNIRKSDNSRYAGIKFSLHNTIENKPTAEAKINADEFILYDSTNTKIFSVHGRSTYLGNFNMQGWGDIPVANLYNGGLLVKDIGIGGHAKSLLKIVEELCNKTGVWWI